MKTINREKLKECIDSAIDQKVCESLYYRLSKFYKRVNEYLSDALELYYLKLAEDEQDDWSTGDYDDAVNECYCDKELKEYVISELKSQTLLWIRSGYQHKSIDPENIESYLESITPH